MNKFLKTIIYILVILALFSALGYFYNENKDVINNLLNSYTISTKFTTWTTANGEDIKSVLKLSKLDGTDVLNDDAITFDDDALDLYKEMYREYYVLDYDEEDFKISKEDFELNNEMMYLINLTSEDGNLVIAANFKFDSTESDYEGITEDYIDSLYVKSVKIFIPNNKLESYIDLATISHSGLSVENEILYSPYKLYELGGHTAVMNVDYWSGSKVKSALIECKTWEYNVSDNENFNETFKFNWSEDINKVADSIFADLFTLTYKEDYVVEKELAYLTTWHNDLILFKNSFASMHEEDSIMLSTLKCRGLNDNNVSEDPAGRNLILEYALTDITTGKDRVFHLLVDVGGSTNDGFEYLNGTYIPVEDEFEIVELFEVVDGVYRWINNLTETIDVSNCKYNPSQQNAYIHIDDSLQLNDTDMNGVEVSTFNLVSLNEYDIPGYIFEKIFYMN